MICPCKYRPLLREECSIYFILSCDLENIAFPLTGRIRKIEESTKFDSGGGGKRKEQSNTFRREDRLRLGWLSIQLIQPHQKEKRKKSILSGQKWCLNKIQVLWLHSFWLVILTDELILVHIIIKQRCLPPVHLGYHRSCSTLESSPDSCNQKLSKYRSADGFHMV